MRNAFAESFYEAAKKNERLAMVVADISAAGSMDKFRHDFPKRFVNTGVAEQIMIGMVAGMAMRGLKPFAYTIATFAMYRPYEFIRDDLCYQHLPVTVVGIGGGVTYSQLGGTHHAMEDVAIACATPNLRVIAPCDPHETKAATEWCINQENGPVYLRLGKAGEQNLGGEEAWEFGKLRKLRDGGDTCIIGYGPILGRYMKKYPEAAAYSCHTMKPLDKDGIVGILLSYNRVIVVEEHIMHLGRVVKEIAWEYGRFCEIECHSLKDEFIHHYGSHDELLEAHGL